MTFFTFLTKYEGWKHNMFKHKIQLLDDVSIFHSTKTGRDILTVVNCFKWMIKTVLYLNESVSKHLNTNDAICCWSRATVKQLWQWISIKVAPTLRVSASYAAFPLRATCPRQVFSRMAASWGSLVQSCWSSAFSLTACFLHIRDSASE